MRFLVIARDGALGFQCSDPNLLHLSGCVLLQLPARLRTLVHDYGSEHLIDGYALDMASAYVRFQRSAEVDWMTCSADVRWYYYNFKSNYIHDVPTGGVETPNQGASRNLMTRRILPSGEVCWVVLQSFVSHSTKQQPLYCLRETIVLMIYLLLLTR